MSVDHYETEEKFYAQFSPEKADAIRAFWASKTPDEIENARQGYIATAHMQDVRDAMTSGEVAVQLLDIAASYLEKREQMPFHLADHIAKAFRAVVKATENENVSVSESRRNTLAAMLNITAPAMRPSVDRRYLGNCVFRLMIESAQKGEPISETKAAKIAARDLNISHRTAKDHWKSWKDTNPDRYQLLLKLVEFNKGG